jgi:hypothetical protein
MRGELMVDEEEALPAPAMPASFNSSLRVVSDQYPHVA